MNFPFNGTLNPPKNISVTHFILKFYPFRFSLLIGLKIYECKFYASEILILFPRIFQSTCSLLIYLKQTNCVSYTFGQSKDNLIWSKVWCLDRIHKKLTGSQLLCEKCSHRFDKEILNTMCKDSKINSLQLKTNIEVMLIPLTHWWQYQNQ